MYIIRDMKENIVFITCTRFEGKLAEGLKNCIEKYFECNVFLFVWVRVSGLRKLKKI